MMRELASGRPLSNPVLQGEGWWRRPERLLVTPIATPAAVADLTHRLRFGRDKLVQPILITGATGTLGSTFARMCERRNLAYRIVARTEMDMADPHSVDAAVARYRPWAIINAAGYVKVNQAETDVDRCRRENTLAPTILALACVRNNLRFVTFSSDLVFDGQARQPYCESDPVSPLSVYGHSKAGAEQCVLDADPNALVIRTSAFFSPCGPNFVSTALDAIERGQRFGAAHDTTVSPTFVPDLVHAALDLLVDKENGIWHLTNGTPVTWLELATMAAQAAHADPSLLDPLPAARLAGTARRPAYSALGSERGTLLPPLADALVRYAAVRSNPSRYIAARSNQ
jgi:dTDP-4-dehydrorhamnose reductase